MQRSIRPIWLLRQADELGGRGKGAGQPRNADLRRAVSAAYYALYHELVLRAAAHLLPGCPDEDRWRISRLFTHRSVRQVCDWVVGPGDPPPRLKLAMLAIRNSSALLDVALAFQTLQQSRYEADYDHLADFTRPATLNLIDQVRDAIAKLKRMEESESYERLMAQIAMHSKPS